MIRKRKKYNSQPLKGGDKKCFFCLSGYTEVDYKDVEVLRRFISSYGKITPRRRNGVCAKHQRKLATAIKRARIMALLPFLTR